MSKTRKVKTTVNPAAIQREAKKIAKSMAKERAPGDMGTIIEPGSLRRESPLEQTMGPRKYREMIHGHNDKNKHALDKLPFTFTRKSVVRSHRSDILIECVECGYQKFASEHTYGIVCPKCKEYRRVYNPEAVSRGEASPEEEEKVGMFGTASDLLALREQRLRDSSPK